MMADKITTIRSDYYKRRKPGVGSKANPIKWSEQAGFYKLDPNDKDALLEQDRLNQLGSALTDVGKEYAPWFPKLPNDPRLLSRRKVLMETNPWLPYLLAEAAKARYDLFTGDEDYYKSKKYGWGEYWNAPPDEDEYFTWGRDDSGKLVPIPSDKAKELEQSNPDYYEFRRKPFADYDEDKAFELIPMTEEEAKGEKLPWYHSTNDYLDAILATRLGEENRQALYEEAHDAFGNYLSGLVKDGKMDADTAQRLLAEASFRPENIIESGVKNFFTPVRHAVTGDPELLKKTDESELKARTAADIGLGAGSFLIPWGIAARGAATASRPLLGALVGGGLGGLANYGLERGANEAFDRYTGYGSDNQPIDLTDATLAGLSGAMTGPLMSANRIRGWKNVRKMMNPREPSTVTRGDIKSSFEASKAAGGDTDKASRLHSGAAMKLYRQAYPNGAMLVEGPPALEAEGVPLATNLPMGNLKDLIASTQGKRMGLELGRGDFGNFVMGRDPSKRIGIPSESPTTVRKMTPDGLKANTARDVNFTIPPLEKAAWKKGDDPLFVSQMVKENPDYYGVDFSLEDIEKGLPKAAKAAQTKGSRESQMFGKGGMVLSDDEFAKLQSAFSGNRIDDSERMKKSFFRKVLAKKSTPGTVENGQFKEGSDKQKKVYKQSLKDYGRRAEQNIVSKEQAKEQMGNNWKTGLGKLGGAAFGAASRNIVPFGSNILFDVQPIEYED